MSYLIVALVGSVVDSGTFVLSQGGKKVGEEKFQIIKTDAGMEVRIESTMGGIAQSGVLRVDANWKPQSGEFEGAGRKMQLVRGADGLLELAGQKASKPVDLFIGNNMLAHVTALCALAGPKKSLTTFPGLPVELAAAEKRGKLTFVRADLMGMVRIELLCDGSKMIALRQPLQGVLAVRSGSEALAVFPDRPKPALPPTLVEESRKIAVRGASLGCSLLLPKQRSGRLPAVVFITGSGAQDRDEDSPGPGGLKLAIFKTMAIALGEAGIGSLRCDDRGVGESTGTMMGATLQTFTEDVKAMVAALRKEKDVDPERIGIIGHSEGGVIGPSVAADDPKARAVVIMAGPGRPIDQVIAEQVERSVRSTGAKDDEVKKALDLQKRTTDAIRDGKPLPAELTAEQRKTAESMATWLRSHMLHDPAATLAKVHAAVMIAQGGKDTQVSIKDAEKLHAAKPDATYKIYPDFNHLFSKAQTGSLTEYSDPNAKVDEGFLKDVVTFVKTAMTTK
jgi:pimeloyl-ACP methyl ester carboxylesterase